MEDIKEKVAEVAHVVQRKASNTVKDIQSGDALHILERKTKNSIEDIKHVAADVGEKLKPHVEHAKEVAHDGLEKIKPGLEKAGAAVSGSVHNAVDKVKEAVGK